MRSLMSVSILVLHLSYRIAIADASLHESVDTAIEARTTSLAPLSDDSEFVRRIFLDIAGRVPSCEEARAFLLEGSVDKRATLIDRLLASPDFPRRMREYWHVQLMERAGENDEWSKYLENAFSANKPWDAIIRDMLSPDADDATTRGAAFFLSKRLENYGQQPVDLPGLTRDVGRLFLGVDLQCAQCHDHLFVEDYKQVDFQGLHMFLSHLSIRSDVKFPAIAEKVVDKKTEFMSVFVKSPQTTGPRMPFGAEFEIPAYAKGEEFAVVPDRKANQPGKPKFSPLAILARELPVPSNAFFVRNGVNRFWCQMMGRGLVHPLDLSHSGNPASHPEVLNMLAAEFSAHNFDVKWLLRELALSRTYQRSSILPNDSKESPRPESFSVAIEKPLSAEQLFWSVLQATGTRQRIHAEPTSPEFTELKKRFLTAMANPPRDPEVEFAPSVKAALFLSNDGRVLELMKPGNGNLAEQLTSQSDGPELIDQLFLSTLSRHPSPDESQAVLTFLSERSDQRQSAISQAIWALITSTEFCMNH